MYVLYPEDGSTRDNGKWRVQAAPAAQAVPAATVSEPLDADKMAEQAATAADEMKAAIEKAQAEGAAKAKEEREAEKARKAEEKKAEEKATTSAQPEAPQTPPVPTPAQPPADAAVPSPDPNWGGVGSADWAVKDPALQQPPIAAPATPVDPNWAAPPETPGGATSLMDQATHAQHTRSAHRAWTDSVSAAEQARLANEKVLQKEASIANEATSEHAAHGSTSPTTIEKMTETRVAFEGGRSTERT